MAIFFAHVTNSRYQCCHGICKISLWLFLYSGSNTEYKKNHFSETLPDHGCPCGHLWFKVVTIIVRSLTCVLGWVGGVASDSEIVQPGRLVWYRKKVAERGFQSLELDLRWKFQGVSVVYVCVLLERLMNRWNIIQYTGMTLFKCCFNTSFIAKIVINTQVFIKFWRKINVQKFCRPLSSNKKSCLIC